MAEIKTLYDVLTENTLEVKDGIRTFPSGNRYRQRGLPGSTNLILIPIIDDVERFDLRLEGRSSYDVYAAVLKREGVLS